MASPSARVVALTVPLALAAAAGALMPRPASLEGFLHLPWWVFIGLFCLTEAFVVRIRVRDELEGLSLSEIPLVIGLYTTEPLHLVAGRVIAGSVVFLLYQRHTLLKAVLNCALVGSSSAAAAVVFGVLVGSREAMGPAGWLAVPVAVTAGGLLEVAVLVLVIGWYGGSSPLRRLLRDLGLAVVVPTGVSALGLAAVFALDSGAGAAVPVAVTGVAAVLGYRSFAALSDRHASLERLYLLSDALAVAPGSQDVVTSVLAQSTDLMRARYSEISLTDSRDGTPLGWSMRHGGPLVADDPAARAGPARSLDPAPASARLVSGVSADERAFLAARDLSEALLVPLRVDGDVGGHLLVGDRRGEERAFGISDGRLLETVANHAVVALRNGRLIERLHFEARHDELTGLPNRLDLRDRLEDLAARAASGTQQVAVMVLDFDGFKAINDTLGHQAGDDLLRVLAKRFAARAGSDAVVARMGGDEFAILSTTCSDPERATELAHRVLAAFDEPAAVGGTRLRVGGSLGIALGPRDGVTGSDLLRNADIAMYAAKTGAGGAVLFHPGLVEVTATALGLATDLRDAVASRAIEVVVQPLVELDGAVLHSVEVLARWTHPRLGVIPPEEFFAAAERSGQVPALSTLVLEQALGWCRTWIDLGRPVRVAVNLAPRWLADPTLPEQVGLALGRHRVPADLLCLEITENSVIADPRRAIETLTRLRDMGVHLSVDDFGTGYSSMTYLSLLPVDQIKIDKSFVSRMLDSHRDRAIVRSIVDLGRHLGLEVVAEGVTDEATRAALRDIGCGLAQGHLFSRATDGANLLGLLDDAGAVRGPASTGEVLPPAPRRSGRAPVPPGRAPRRPA